MHLILLQLHGEGIPYKQLTKMAGAGFQKGSTYSQLANVTNGL